MLRLEPLSNELQKKPSKKHQKTSKTEPRSPPGHLSTGWWGSLKSTMQRSIFHFQRKANTPSALGAHGGSDHMLSFMIYFTWRLGPGPQKPYEFKRNLDLEPQLHEFIWDPRLLRPASNAPGPTTAFAPRTWSAQVATVVETATLPGSTTAEISIRTPPKQEYEFEYEFEYGLQLFFQCGFPNRFQCAL